MPDLLQDEFDRFWAAFPAGRKAKKAEARGVFASIVNGKHRKLKATPQQLIEGATRYRAAVGDHYQYVMLPTTWLRAGCWEDEDVAPPASLPARVGQANDSTRGRSLTQDLLDDNWAK